MGNLRKLPKNWNLMFILSNGCVHFVTDSQSVICLSSLMFVVHICVCVTFVCMQIEYRCDDTVRISMQGIRNCDKRRLRIEVALAAATTTADEQQPSPPIPLPLSSAISTLPPLQSHYTASESDNHMVRIESPNKAYSRTNASEYVCASVCGRIFSKPFLFDLSVWSCVHTERSSWNSYVQFVNV